MLILSWIKSYFPLSVAKIAIKPLFNSVIIIKYWDLFGRKINNCTKKCKDKNSLLMKKKHTSSQSSICKKKDKLNIIILSST